MKLSKMKNFIFTTLLIIAPASALHAQNTRLLEEEFLSGECSPVEKQNLLETFTEGNNIGNVPMSYTISETGIDRRSGSSPPTGKAIPALTTVFCLAQSSNKILVTAQDSLGKSCGWVDENDLADVSNPDDMGSSVGKCGDIKPLSVGKFCSKVAGMDLTDLDTKILLKGCNLAGVKDSSIDAKFVTDNTSVRLSDLSESQELVRRKIPVYPTSDSKQPSGSVDVFSLTQVFGVEPKQGGKVSILLGLGNYKWLD